MANTIKAFNPVTGKSFDINATEFESTYKPLGWTTTAPTAPAAAPVTAPTTTPQSTTTPAGAPEGSVVIDGAKFNTKETQQANFTNIQPIGNTLYGIPKAPVVPDVISQKDLGNALSSQTSAETSAQAQGLVGFSDVQVQGLNAAYTRQLQGKSNEIDDKNLAYAMSKGWQPSEGKEETIQPTTALSAPEPTKSTVEQIFDAISNLGNLRAEARAQAMEDEQLMAKGEAIATAQTLVNNIRTEIQNKMIYDIKEQDVVRAKPILTSQIQGQLNEMSREQKLDAMIMQNNYNNALVELQIAQGNYDRAREIVKETADDAFESAKFQLDALMFKNQIEEREYDRTMSALEYERSLALEGYTYLRSPEELKGLTENEIFRDPVSGKIYLKPEPTISRVMEINGRQVGLDDKGNVVRDFGAVKVSGSGGGGSSGGGLTPIKLTTTDEKNILDIANSAPGILSMSTSAQYTVLKNLSNNAARADFTNWFMENKMVTGVPGQEQSSRFTEPTLESITEYKNQDTKTTDSSSIVQDFLNKPSTTTEKVSLWNKILNIFK